MAQRLPAVGSDSTTWGTVLNGYLGVGHNADGTHHWYDVREYGAVGNGTTDDTAAIQSAITAAQATGGVVFFPAGTYLISSTLTITADNVQLVGVGRGSQLQAKSTFTATPMVWVEGPGGAGNFRHGFAARGLLIVNTASSAAVIGLQLDSTYYAVVERVDVEGVFGTSIYLNGISTAFGAYTHVRDCHLGAVSGGGGSAGTGILSSNHEHWTVESCTINWFSTAGGVGIKVTSSACSILDCDFDECDTALWLYFCQLARVMGNNFDRSLTRFVYLNGCNECRLIGNDFDTLAGAGTDAVYLDNNCADNIIQGNNWQTGTTWVNAIHEAVNTNKVNYYTANDLGGLAVVRNYGVFRGNAGYNPLQSLAAPAAPSVAASGSGSTIAAGTYQVAVTLVSESGETAGSTATSVTPTAGQDIVITAPAPAGNAYGWYAYVTQAGGAANTATRQQTAGAPSAFGANLTLTAPPTNTGAVVPTSNTTTDVTTPSVPATATPLKNTTGVDVTVYLTGGTVTVVTIGNKATGLTAGTFRLPAGQTITLTYSVAPTWVWMGE